MACCALPCMTSAALMSRCASGVPLACVCMCVCVCVLRHGGTVHVWAAGASVQLSGSTQR